MNELAKFRWHVTKLSPICHLYLMPQCKSILHDKALCNANFMVHAAKFICL